MSKQEILTELIKAIYAKYPAGGALHIVLDDGNTEDSHILWCKDHVADYAEKDDAWLFNTCAEILLSMPERKRDTAIAKAFKEMEEEEDEDN